MRVTVHYIHGGAATFHDVYDTKVDENVLTLSWYDGPTRSFPLASLLYWERWSL